mmetsp:Transcript_58952/g.172570  ORF Transcript_58952/g.172570 Transcript_58952/m.172570 type:complete len:377 (+) Transcript_58952:32-1162(+)
MATALVPASAQLHPPLTATTDPARRLGEVDDIKKAELESLPEGACKRFVFSNCSKGLRCKFSHDVDRAALRAAAGIPEAPFPPRPSRSVITSAESANAEPASMEALDGQTANGEQARRPAWRSIDWLLRGDSVHKNSYLQELATAHWLPDLLGRSECLSLLNMRGRSLRKEISESFGALHACHRALAKLGIDTEERVTVVDLCCGKGLGSLILALSMPNAQVLAVDTNPNMELAHFRRQPNLSFLALDITSGDAGSRLAAAVADRVSRTDHPEAAPLLVVGVHLCGSLSVHAIQLFNDSLGSAALVLVPCCLDGRQPTVKQRAKKLRIDPHRYWCLSLLMSLPISIHERRELLVDDTVISEKNSFLIATRKAESGC